MKFMVPGCTEAEADRAQADREAFRAQLVDKGILGEPKLKDPEFTSEVPGVSWDKSLSRQKWKVQVPRNKGKRYGGIWRLLHGEGSGRGQGWLSMACSSR